MMIFIRFLNAGNGTLFAIAFLTVVVVNMIAVKCEETLTVEPAVELKRLRSDLLSSYDRLVRPAKDQSKPTRVTVYFDVQHIVSLDEKFEILSIQGSLMMKWTDEHLIWSPDSYSHISVLHFTPSEVWLPDIHSFYNVKPQNIYDEGITTSVTIYSNGSVKWYPQIVFDVPCSAQYRHYPFDNHNCSILLSAWKHEGESILLQKMELPSSKPKTLQGSEWLLTRVEHENVVLDEFYKVYVHLFLQRTSSIYRYICVVPTVISMVSVLFGFWLLPNETARYLVGCSNIVVLSMLLQYLAVTVPSGKIIPLIAQYCACCLCMSAAFVVVTVIANLLRECSGIPPNGLVRLVNFTLDRYLFIFTFAHVSSEGSNDIVSRETTGSMTSPDQMKRRKDWYIVAMFVDRIAFWCFVFLYVVFLSVLAAV